MTDVGVKGLIKNLNIWEAIGISVALMAPSMAANINPQGTATTVGRAVPVAFALATIGVLLVAYGFVRLSQNFHHAGSVYGFVGATTGPRSGVVAGWGLIGTYIFYGCVTSMAAGIFGAKFLDEIGLWKNQSPSAGFLVGAIALVLAYFLAIVPARNGTRLLLIVEAITVVLILITAFIVLGKLIGGTAPNGLGVDMSVFSIPSGTGGSTVFLGVVFGFLSFAGFEAAATLGEEARNPRKDIPRAILGTAIFGGVYFVFVTAVEMMGFGTSEAGVKSFIASGSLMGDLGTQYVGSWIGTIITLGAAVSAFGCCLACIVGSSRMLFAMGRDSGNLRLAAISSKNGTPTMATRMVSGAAAIIIALWAIIGNAKPFDIFVGSGVIGTLILVAVYVFATIGAIKFLFLSGTKRAATWEIIIPIVGLVVLIYTLYRNVIPFPTSGASRMYPIVSALWLAVGVITVFARPAFTKKLGTRLLADENLSASR